MRDPVHRNLKETSPPKVQSRLVTPSPSPESQAAHSQAGRKEQVGTVFAQLCMDMHPKGYTNPPIPSSLPQVGQPGLNLTAVQLHSTK